MPEVPRTAGRARWVAGAAVLGVAFVLWLVLFAPRLLIPAASQASLHDVIDAAKRHELQDSRLKLQNDVRTTLFQGLGGLAVVVGAVFTYRQVQTSRRQLEHTIESSRQQHELDREGQVTERFTRAIDQLGHTQLDVRLGGIYALERIARDSPDDRATIGEVLTAFVRGHAPWPSSQPGQDALAVPPEPVASLEVRAADIRAIMTVLGRNTFPAGRAVFPPMKQGFGVDLRMTDLRGADLGGAHLEGANLWDAHLEGSNLRGTHLEEAFLNGAHLEESFLLAVHLEGADLGGVYLEEANLGTAHLEKAFLGGAHLENANLRGAQLQGAILDGTHLNGVHLEAAVADRHTSWPAGFDWRAAGVIFEGDDPGPSSS
jgi:hypothetical protein